MLLKFFLGFPTLGGGGGGLDSAQPEGEKSQMVSHSLFEGGSCEVGRA